MKILSLDGYEFTPGEYAEAPAGFDDGYSGYEGDPPPFDEHAWASVLPLLPTLRDAPAVDASAIAIKWNNAHVAGPCGLCDGIADPWCGLALFLADSFDPVCDRCGEKYAPTMAAIVRMHQAIKAEDQ